MQMCVGKAMSQVCKNVIIQPHEYPEAFRAIIRFSWWFGRSQPHPSGQLNHFTVFPKHYWLSLPPDLHCVTVKFSDKVSPDRGWDRSCLALFTDTKMDTSLWKIDVCYFHMLWLCYSTFTDSKFHLGDLSFGQIQFISSWYPTGL